MHRVVVVGGSQQNWSCKSLVVMLECFSFEKANGMGQYYWYCLSHGLTKVGVKVKRRVDSDPLLGGALPPQSIFYWLKMKVHFSYITSQADSAHKRFIDALQQLPTAKGLQREFLLEDLSYALKLANHLQEQYPNFIKGQTEVKVKHMTARSIQQWLAFVKIDHNKNNLVKAY